MYPPLDSKKISKHIWPPQMRIDENTMKTKIDRVAKSSGKPWLRHVSA
jgi:hypothetical protein